MNDIVVLPGGEKLALDWKLSDPERFQRRLKAKHADNGKAGPGERAHCLCIHQGTNDLDALPQTVNHNALYDPEIGCLDYKGIRKLSREVYNSFFHTTKTERIFTITEREWDGQRTAHNSDGSHRFSYWRQLALIPTVPYRIRARIAPFSLNEKAFLSLISSWRIVAVTRSGEGTKDAMDMATFWPEGFCPIIKDRYNDSSQDYWIVPQPHMAPLEYRDPLITVHQKLDELRPFEPLRIIAEQRVMPTASKPWRKDRL